MDPLFYFKACDIPMNEEEQCVTQSSRIYGFMQEMECRKTSINGK